MRVLSTLRFTLLRLIRNVIVLLLLLVVPVVLLTFFSFILSGVTAEDGTPYSDQNALTMVLVFQLFGGSTVMHYINNDLFTVNRMRMYAAPFNKTMYAFSIMMCGTAFSVVLGVILMAYSQLALGVRWDSWGWTVYLIFLMSVLSSIVCILFLSSVKKYKLAERLSEVYGIGCVVLAGLFFPLPQNRLFDFLGSYGNPLTLSVGAITERSRGNIAEAWLQANLLLGAAVILFAVMLVLGRRRLK